MSFFEYFGLNPQDSTLLPEIGVDKNFTPLVRQTQKYFKISQDAAMDGNKLAVVIEIKFDVLSNEHTDLMKEVAALFVARKKKLSDYDKVLMGAILGAVVLGCVPWVPMLGWLAMAGWLTALYCMNQRTLAYTQYHESLTLLAAVCNWSLGPQASERQHLDNNTLIKNSAVRDMMGHLYPVLTQTQIKHLIADDIERCFTDALASYESNFRLFGSVERAIPNELEQTALKKKSADFFRCVYGLNQGNALDFVNAFLSAIPDLWRISLSAIHNYRTSSASEESTAPQV